MGAWGFAILVIGALVLAVSGEAIGRPPSRRDIPIVGAGAMLGGYVASEWLGGTGSWGWALAFWPFPPWPEPSFSVGSLSW